jgi:Ca2+-binding RTX toxin-like protein
VLSATVDTITSGSGDDSITMYNGDMTLDGGAGDDTLVATAVDVSDDTVSISNVEVISMTTVNTTFKVGQLSGTETVTGTTGDLTITGTAAAADTIDLSGFTVGLTQAAGAAGGFLKATGLAGADTITGSSSSDAINGGAGADTITAGNGVDYITGGTGGDTIDLTEATANSSADYLIIASMTDGSADGVAGGTFSGYDVVTGFLSGTDKVLGDSGANASDTTTLATALFTDAACKTVMASTAATLAASDLTATTALDVDSVVAFLADGTVAGLLNNGAGYTAADKSLLGVTVADTNQTFLYALESADTTFTADEINLVAVLDDVIVVGDLIVA